MSKLLLALVFSLSVLGGICRAQYEVLKSREGVVLLSKKPGQAFSVEIAASRQLAPVGMDSAPHPYFMVDGRFLQVMTVPFREFKGDPTTGEEEILQRHRRYEAGFHGVEPENIVSKALKLRGGSPALFWSFTPAQVRKEQAFLTFPAKGYVVVFGSAVEGKDSLANVQKFLLKIAGTFRPYSRPVSLKFSADGRYEPE